MWIKLLLLFFVFSFLFKTDSSFDQDLGRHIKLGEIITQTHTVPKTNLFSYTSPDFPFINTHWLFEVLMYGANQTIGLQAVLILKIIIFLSSVWLVIKIVPKEKTALLLPIGFIFLHVLRERTELRPEIFSFLFTVCTYYILELSLRPRTRSGGSNLLFLLPIIQLIWINTHIYFFVGLILQMIFLIHLSLKRIGAKLDHLEGGLRWHLLLICLLLSISVSFLNPNGIAGILYPLNVTKNYGYTIVENQTMFLLESINFHDPNFLFVKLSGGLIILSLVVAFATRKFELKNILLASTGLGLALLNVRSFPYLVLISLPAVLSNFPILKFKGFIKAITFIIIPILILESFFYLNGDYYRFNDQPVKAGLEFKESGKQALDFLITKDLPQPIFNNFDIGSYIIYKAYPKYRVFVDGRPEAYPQEFFLQTYIPVQSDYAKFKELNRQVGFKTVIFSHTDQTPWGRNFLQNVVKDEDWNTVYIDDFIIILVKKGVALGQNLTTLNLDKLNPKKYDFKNHTAYLRLGYFLLATNNVESGVKFITQSLMIFPQSPLGNAILGNRGSNNFFGF